MSDRKIINFVRREPNNTRVVGAMKCPSTRTIGGLELRCGHPVSKPHMRHQHRRPDGTVIEWREKV